MAKKITETKPASPKIKVEKAVKPKAEKVKAAVKEAKPVKSIKAVKPTVSEKKAVEPYSLFTDFDIALFQSGKHYKLYEKLGSHVLTHSGVIGTYFAVWAPNAHYVSVIGGFNGWDRG